MEKVQHSIHHLTGIKIHSGREGKGREKHQVWVTTVCREIFMNNLA